MMQRKIDGLWSPTIDEVEIYDPKINVWHQVWKMSLNRSALSAVVVHGLENAKEYTWLRRELIEKNVIPRRSQWNA